MWILILNAICVLNFIVSGAYDIHTDSLSAYTVLALGCSLYSMMWFLVHEILQVHAEVLQVQIRICENNMMVIEQLQKMIYKYD